MSHVLCSSIKILHHERAAGKQQKAMGKMQRKLQNISGLVFLRFSSSSGRMSIFLLGRKKSAKPLADYYKVRGRIQFPS